MERIRFRWRGDQSSRRKPTQAQEEHANTTKLSIEPPSMLGFCLCGTRKNA